MHGIRRRKKKIKKTMKKALKDEGVELGGCESVRILYKCVYASLTFATSAVKMPKNEFDFL